MEVKSEYPKDTIGYHFLMSKAVFGEESAPTKWLLKKAEESEKGLDEGVVMDETQVVYLLGQMFLKERSEKS